MSTENKEDEIDPVYVDNRLSTLQRVAANRKEALDSCRIPGTDLRRVIVGPLSVNDKGQRGKVIWGDGNVEDTIDAYLNGVKKVIASLHSDLKAVGCEIKEIP